MKGAELLVRCLENEDTAFIFGIPGEENLAVMDALLDSSIQFVTTRHEQGAAFMADVYGRLTGRAGVCLATLGPGATNLITGVADANMDHAPLIAIAGQAATTRLHKESHQVLDLAVGVVGDINLSLQRIADITTPHEAESLRPLRQALIEDMNLHRDDKGCPVKPQKIIWDLRTALALEDIVICDVGAHKLWMARMFRCEHPNTCIISNGFASMGIAVPGAIAGKLAFPERNFVAVTGDAGFLMNSQELETAMRLGIAMVVLIWNDGGYGLIEWKQVNTYGRLSNVRFGNPDFVKYAESFGAKGYRVESADALLPILKQALADNTVSIIDCPVDYSENLKLTERLGETVFQL